MPFFAWYSRKSDNLEGTATYLTPSGQKVEVTEVAEGMDELAVDPITGFDDLVFLGEVTNCVRLADNPSLGTEDVDEEWS